MATRWTGSTLALGLVVVLGCGCYGYAYQSRGPGPAFQAVPYDNQGHSSVRWSYLWGTLRDQWSPIECSQTDAQGRCTQYINVCDVGIARVEATTPGYALPLAVVTLGIVMPVKITAYCSTQTEPREGP